MSESGKPELVEDPPSGLSPTFLALGIVALVLAGVAGFFLIRSFAGDGDNAGKLDPADFIDVPENMTIVKQGLWEDRDYAISGHVSLVRLDSDDSLLVYIHDDLVTMDGPDLQVWISSSETLANNNELNESDPINLGAVTTVSLASQYPVNSADEDYALAAGSIAIECVAFDRLWGAARMTDAE